MKELIFSIFNAVAEEAMNKNQSITLRYENSQHNSKTIFSESKTDEDALTMNIYPIPKSDSDEEEAHDYDADEEEAHDYDADEEEAHDYDADEEEAHDYDADEEETKMSEMEKLRSLLDEAGIEWRDESEMEDFAGPGTYMERTKFEYKGEPWSVIHGYGSYGGYNCHSRDEGLLEVMKGYPDGDQTGFLTAAQAMKMIKGE